MYKIINLTILIVSSLMIRDINANEVIEDPEPKYSSIYIDSTNPQTTANNLEALMAQGKPIENTTPVIPQQSNTDTPNLPAVTAKTPEIKDEEKKDIIVPKPPAVTAKTPEIKSKSIQSQNTHQQDDIKEEEIIIEEVILETELYERPIYDHKTITLSPNISKKSYSDNNKHLPKVFYQSEYTSLLFEAVRSNDIPGIKSLITKGANINAQEISSGYTPVMYAVKYNRLKALRSLIIHGADLQKANLQGQTPLHIAVNNGNAQAIEILMTGGADPTIKDKKGNRPSDYMKANMQNSAMIMVGNYQDKTKALIDFVGLSAYDAVRSALDAGAKIDARDQLTIDGDTPLIIAIKCQDIKMVSLL